jgi:serine/threonine protein kinase/class 3 adenylate cyclase
MHSPSVGRAVGLDSYRLRAQLGAGPDGVAYRAETEDGQTRVVAYDLSSARAEPSRWIRLLSRLRLAAELNHPAAVRILELGVEHDPPYVILEWAGTKTLAAAGELGLKFDDAARRVASALTGALGAAHRLGLAHGRLSPERVFVGDDGQPKLDFTGAHVGFPADPPQPERFDDTTHAASEPPVMADERAGDLLDLGALLEWLQGRRLDQQMAGSIDAPIDAAKALPTLVMKLRSPDPAERPTAAEVQTQLESLVEPLDATGNWGDTEAIGSATMVLPRTNARVQADSCNSLAAGTTTARLGRYELLDKLGEGGQGVVYRASDPADGSIVALKVLRTDRGANSTMLARFRKEARLMAQVNNPNVVNLLEFNEDDGAPYLVLEFVAGAHAGQLLEERGPLDVPTALAIMAGVASGLADAHERGIVHRDIKPSNILLLESPGAATAALPRIKVSDFGLARQVVDTESMAMTAAGALLGTPHYMAPEQWTGRAIDPRTDVYAMGATLFHMLAGRPPFAGTTRDELCTQHCELPPPSLEKLIPQAGPGVARLVDRALSKRPEDRHIDAGAFLRDLEAVRGGEPADLAVHPRLPDCDPSRVLHFDFEWELESTPRQLWPLVTDTDRLNRAIGFEAVTVTRRFEPDRGVRVFTEGRKAGMAEIGEDHPYEWVEPRRMSILREYSAGPFRWAVSIVELNPRPGGGTKLIHRLRLEPVSWTIRLGSRWGVGISLRKNLERVYRRIDTTQKSQAGGGPAAGVDPFEESPPLAAARRERLEGVLDHMVRQGLDPNHVERLGDHVARGSSQEVARIRPLALAAQFGLDPDQLATACLHGARLGLLVLYWDLLCPVCRVTCQTKDTLRAIDEHAHCDACNLDFQLDFAGSVEMIFRAHPDIRDADVGVYCTSGPAHSPHVFAQVRVAPGERVQLDLDLSAGSYRLRGPQLPWSIDFEVQPTGVTRRWEIDLASVAISERAPRLRTGGQCLTLVNPHARELVVRCERTAGRGDALTAARAMAMALFRELFPSEVLAPGRLAVVSTVNLLFAAFDRAYVDTLYNDLGDMRAFSVLYEQLERLGDGVRRGGGTLVKTTGEGVLAAFDKLTAAVTTALALLDRGAVTADDGMPRLRVGVHRGPALAVTLNDQLDYFGGTVRQTAAILEHAGPGDAVLSHAVASDPEVAGALAARGIEAEVIATDPPGQPRAVRIRGRPEV